MRRLIVSMNVTLNGCVAGPYGELDWHVTYWNDELAHALSVQLGEADTILLGRNTYEAMAAYWPAMQKDPLAPRDDADYADMMNSYQKVVFSETLKSLNWRNSRLAGHNVLNEVTALKNKPGKDIIIYGSCTLVTSLARLQLIDEYWLWIHPVVLKKGRPLFKGLQDLKLIGIKRFCSGVVLMQFVQLLEGDLS